MTDTANKSPEDREEPQRFSILRWLAWTFGASAVAAVVAFAAVLLFTPRLPELGGYAMLHDAMASESVVVFQIDKDQREVVLLAETSAPGPGKDYEIWVMPAGKAPVSLGLVPAGERVVRPIDRMRAAILAPGVTMAVSVEPAGGSSSGSPTGPIVFTGLFHLVGN